MQCELYTASVIVKITQQASLMASYTRKTEISEGCNMTIAKPSKHSTTYAQKFRFWWGYSLNVSIKLIFGSFGFSNCHLHGSIDLNSNVLNLILTRIPRLPLLKVHFCKNWKSSADSSLIIVFNNSFITAQHKGYSPNAYWGMNLKMWCFSWKKTKPNQNKPGFLFKTHEKESGVCYKKVAYTLGAQWNLYRSIRCALVRNSSLLRYLKDKCYPQISV